MINTKWIKNNQELFEKKMLLRGVKKHQIEELINLLNDSNIIEQQLNKLRNNKNNEVNNINLTEEEKEKNRELRNLIQEKNKEYTIIIEKIEDLIKHFPNILDDSVPQGLNDKDNIEIRRWDSDLKCNGAKLHHEFLNEDLINKIHTMSAARFTGLNGKLSIVHRAIASFALDFLHSKGFTEYSLPYMLNKQALECSGHVPFFEEDLFWLEDKKFALIPTSEVSIANILHEQTFNKKDLPLKVCSYSPCFRKEAGAAGRDTKGLIRLHQFHKVEMFAITNQNDSIDMHEYMVSLVEEILKKLNLSYRLLLLCSGDTGYHSSKTYDLEVWMPIHNKYLEISSCSNVKDFQGNRLKAKYKDGNEKYVVHTLNGSCLPIERTLSAIIENYQQTDGSIIVPEVLRRYTNFDSFRID